MIESWENKSSSNYKHKNGRKSLFSRSLSSKTLPNCSSTTIQTDKASILEEAMKYVKSLKFQVEAMAAERQAMYQALYMSSGGIQSKPFPQFTPTLPNMFGMYYSSRCPMISTPPSLQFPLISVSENFAVPRMPMVTPLQAHSHSYPNTSFDSSTLYSNFVPGVTSQVADPRLIPPILPQQGQNNA